MNTDKQKTLTDSSQRNPFWVCCAVFLLLACDYGYRLATLWEQRQQLEQTALEYARPENEAALRQSQQLEERLQAFSLDLLQIAKTNAAAKQIVQEFNIQWNPSPAAPASAPAAGKQPR